MNATTDEILQRVRAHVRRGDSLLLCLDYDGTLTPIADLPRMARLDRRTLRLLIRVSRLPRVNLAVISGRPLNFLQSNLAISECCLAGSCGLEYAFHGIRAVHPLAVDAEQLIAKLVPRLTDTAACHPGAWIENKRLSCTVHYRRVQDSRIAHLIVDVEKLLHSWLPHIRITPGPMALEIMPEVGCDKGTAVQVILNQVTDKPCLVIYAGDSANDASAFEVVHALGGMTVGVGPQAPESGQYRLADVSELRILLGELVQSMARIFGRRSNATDEYLAVYALWKPFAMANWGG